MTYEQVFTWIVAPLFAAAAGIWALYAKQFAPAKIKASDDKLRAQLEALEDSREHRQFLETEGKRLDALNTSWANEKLFEEAHENNVFIRGDVSRNLSEIKAMQRQHELKQAALESKLTLLIGILAELRDDQRNHTHGTLTNEH